MTMKPLAFIVEDEPTWRASLTSLLGKHGYQLQTFTKGEDLIQHLKEKPQEKPQLLLLDYHLEGKLTGLDTLKQIRSQLKDTYIVMFSAQDDIQTALEVLKQEVYDYVVKSTDALKGRLPIILKNIEETERLKKEVIELTLKIKRNTIGVSVLVMVIFIVVSLIYLWVCPKNRELKWDPFERAKSERCQKVHPH